jgi:ABC-2 type transport system permease protein
MNILRQEIKYYLRVTIIWTAALAFIAFGFLSLFSGFTGDVSTAKHLLSAYPPQVLAALNLQVGIFFTVIGFFAYLLTFVWMVASIQAMNLGMGVLSKEISGKTADFLLSKPITRFSMLTQKLGAAFILLLGTNIVFGGVAIFSANTFSKAGYDHKLMFYAISTVFLIQLIFMALGFCLASVVPKIKTVLAYTLPTVFGLFIIGAFGSVIGKEEINYFTPFKYFDIAFMLKNGYFQSKYLWLTGAVIVVLIFVGYLVFMTKDIEAAN